SEAHCPARPWSGRAFLSGAARGFFVVKRHKTEGPVLYKGGHRRVLSREQVGEGRARTSNGRDESDPRRAHCVVRFLVLPDDNQTGLPGVRVLGQRDNNMHRAFNGPDRPPKLLSYVWQRPPQGHREPKTCLFEPVFGARKDCLVRAALFYRYTARI